MTYINGKWMLYAGGDSVTGDIRLSPHLGLVIGLDYAAYLGVFGVRQVSGEVDIVQGINFVGLPNIPAAYKKPSDFLTDNVYAVITENEGDFYLIGRVGDDGDELLVEGQAVLIFSGVESVLDLRETITEIHETNSDQNLLQSP